MPATKTHAADLASAAAAKTASSYIATLFLGTGKFAKAPAATLDEARAAAADLMRKHPMCTRRPMVYAILPNGSQELVPDAVAAPAAQKAQAKHYSKRFNAERAAKAAGLDPVWLDFIKEPQGWTWVAKGQPAPAAKAPRAGAKIVPVGPAADDFTPPAFLAKGATASTEPVAMPGLAAMAAAVEKGEKIDLPPAPVAPAKPGRAGKAAKAAPADAAPAPAGAKRITAKHQAMIDAAMQGTMPQEPDFSANTHARYRARLAKVTELAKAGDIAGLKGLAIRPICSSTIPMDRYRNLCVMALEARAAK